MAISIVEKVLGTTNPYTTNYLDETLRLTKSIIVKSSNEASTYNDYVRLKHKKIVDRLDKKSWRYYKHLDGEYHEVDVPMVVISRDNREEITLTKDTLDLHIETKLELCKFGAFYDEVINKYPEQELLLKSMMAFSDRIDINELINLEDWEIVCYNKNLVERQESDLIYRLQERITNYSVRAMITNYSVGNNMFMATLIPRLYNFIMLQLLGIRLANAKSSRVHSFHMLSYFSSHHGLDKYYEYMDDYQRLFLYRNLLYLDRHAGSNETFDLLVDKLFTRRRISAVNYVYHQANELRDDLATDYFYKQNLLNNANFVYDVSNFDVYDLADKEIRILANNKKEYDFNIKDIDFKMTNSLNNSVMTKDIEINLRDHTNEVKYKLLGILLDYWAVTTHWEYNNALVEFVNPVTGEDHELLAKDGFKLFCVLVHYAAGLKIKTIPDYHAWRVFKKKMPSLDFIYGKMQRNDYDVKKLLELLRVRTPMYKYIDTKRALRSFIEAVYRFELGVWIITGSTGELYNKSDINAGFEAMHQPVVCKNDDEDVSKFLERIGLEDIEEYSMLQCEDLLGIVINAASDNALELSENNRLTQEAMTAIFSKFKSYTTQILSDYHSSNRTLANLIPPSYSTERTNSCGIITHDLGPELNCTDAVSLGLHVVRLGEEVESSAGSLNIHEVNVEDNINIIINKRNYLGHVDTHSCITMDQTHYTPPVITKLDFYRIFGIEG